MYPISKDTPDSWFEAVWLPSTLAVIAFLIWFYGMRKGKSWKWSAFIPLLIGLYVGITTPLKLNDVAYSLNLSGRDRVIQAHYVAPVLPALAMIIILYWHFAAKRERAYDNF